MSPEQAERLVAVLRDIDRSLAMIADSLAGITEHLYPSSDDEDEPAEVSLNN